ncbi:MAG TPA: DoxX family protein [Vicinamibacterales bacterium]|nr:DoxX family protein [Vicinamibacterales bacterium]
MRKTLSLDLGLALLRAALGIVFIAHGGQKFFVIGHEALSGFFSAIVPFPEINAWIVPAVELGGGIALLAGAATRIAGALLAFTMLVAMVTVHLANGFFMQNNGYEFVLTLLLANVALALTGAGAFSVDRLIASRRTPAGPAEAFRQAA